jgi:hypothetical protein
MLAAEEKSEREEFPTTGKFLPCHVLLRSNNNNDSDGEERSSADFDSLRYLDDCYALDSLLDEEFGTTCRDELQGQGYINGINCMTEET